MYNNITDSLFGLYPLLYGMAGIMIVMSVIIITVVVLGKLGKKEN